MINKNAMLNGFNMESSMGLHCDLFDSNKSIFNKVRDESISEGFKYCFGQYEEPYPPTNLLSSENTINFADIEKRLFNSNPNTPPYEGSSVMSQSAQDRMNWADTDQLLKRGLKNLASLLLQTLIRKRFSSHNEVAEEIERHLMIHDMHGIETVKEQKNIKRRIYDALNVMISAKVLEKQMHSLQPRTQTVARNYTVVSKLEEHRTKYKKMKSRLENKRELLAKMQSKRNALLLWMEKKGRVKEKESKVARFQFPVVIVICDRKQRLKLQTGDSWLAMGFGCGQVYSQTDLIQEAMKSEDILQVKSVKVEEKLSSEITYI